MTIARQLSEAACALTLDALSAQARAKLELCLLANLTVGVAGVPATRVPVPAIDGPLAGPDTARGFVLLSGASASRAEDAAFYNGCAMHARTQDDFHPVGNLHLATVVVPAALAAAEDVACDGARLLEAVAAGYQVAIGLSRSLGPLTTPRGLRATTLYAPFGAAAAVARVHRLDVEGCANALALVTSLAGGITQCWVDGSDEYQMHAGWAAEIGLRAVRLTRAGLRGASHAFEGPAGFITAFTGASAPPQPLDLDASRALVETVLKRYPVSGICQPIVHLAERLVERGVRAQDVQSIRIEMNPAEMRYPGTLNRGPFHSFSDVLMSAACCLSSVLTTRRLDFQDLLTLARPERDALIERIEIVDDPALGKLSDRVEVRLRDGSTVRESIEAGGAIIAPSERDVDAWAQPLWAEVGRGDGYPALRAAVAGLAGGGIGDLVRALRV